MAYHEHQSQKFSFSLASILDAVVKNLPFDEIYSKKPQLIEKILKYLLNLFIRSL